MIYFGQSWLTETSKSLLTRKVFNNAVEKFSLKVECRKTKNGIQNDVVYSNQLKWLPIGNQAEVMPGVRPVFGDIIINKLRFTYLIIGLFHHHVKHKKSILEGHLKRQLKNGTIAHCELGVFECENFGPKNHFLGYNVGPLAVSCKCSDMILISPSKYRNLNNRIRTPVARFLHLFCTFFRRSFPQRNRWREFYS